MYVASSMGKKYSNILFTEFDRWLRLIQKQYCALSACLLFYIFTRSFKEQCSAKNYYFFGFCNTREEKTHTRWDTYGNFKTSVTAHVTVHHKMDTIW